MEKTRQKRAASLVVDVNHVVSQQHIPQSVRLIKLLASLGLFTIREQVNNQALVDIYGDGPVIPALPSFAPVVSWLRPLFPPAPARTKVAAVPAPAPLHVHAKQSASCGASTRREHARVWQRWRQ